MTVDSSLTSDQPSKKSGMLPGLILLIIIGIIVSVSVTVSQSSKEVTAVRKQVASLGGKIKFEQKVPGWLSAIVGPNFHTVLDRTEFTELELTGPGIGDAELESLKKLSDLKILVLNETKITDAGMVHLKGMQKLEKLILNYTRVKDISVLAGMKFLNELNLLHTSVEDEDLAVVETLPALHTIGLGWRNIKGPGLAHLQKISQQLEGLVLEGAELSDEEMKMLHDFPNLKVINLAHSKCSQKSMEELAKAIPDLKFVGR